MLRLAVLVGMFAVGAGFAASCASRASDYAIRRRLFGVDDPAAFTEISRKLAMKTRIRPRFGSVLGVGGVAGGLAAVAHAALNLDGFWSDFGSAALCASFAIGAFLYTQLQREARRLLPEILAAEGRCIRCGYERAGDSFASCSECGAVRASTRPEPSEQSHS